MKGLVKVNLVVIVNGLVRVKRIVRAKGVFYVGSGGYMCVCLLMLILNIYAYATVWGKYKNNEN